jgi:hypothetical protein
VLVLTGLLGSTSPGRAQVASASAPVKVTFKTLATYPVDDLGQQKPPSIESLDGKAVVITGYMLPVNYARGRTREFMLMRTQAACCFGQPPKANEFLLVTTEATDGVPVTQDVPSTFSGIMRIKPEKLGNNIVQCFRIEGARPR